MEYKINKLITELNKLYKSENLIEIGYLPDNTLYAAKGDVKYFFDYSKLSKILEVNNANLRDEPSVYKILTSHISNQLEASLGKKIYPDIVSIASDNI